MMQKVEKKPTSTGVDCPKGTQTIDVICSGVPSHKELHECCDVTKPFLVVEQMDMIVEFLDFSKITKIKLARF